MIKQNMKRKKLCLVLACIVLIFAGVQFDWLFNHSQSVVAALSILSSLGLATTLMMLATNNHDEVNGIDEVATEQQNEATQENTDKKPLDSAEPQESMALCNSEADEYFITIKEDLNQVDRLVSDAVNNLVLNFGYITKLSKTHHDMVLAIEKMAIPDGNAEIIALLDKQMVIADKIETELGSAMTSLQFGDLVTQLVAHTKNQVETLNRVLQRIDRQDDWKGQVRSAEEVQEGITNAVKTATAKSKRKPVVQQEMQMGDIELF